MLNFLKRLNPFRFTHDTSKFKLNVSRSSFSSDYVCFKYSGNGGIIWKTIHRCSSDPDILWGYYKWEDLTYSLGSGKFDYEKNKFSSYQKILDYEKIQKEMYINNNERIEKQKKERKKQKKEAYLRANK